MTLHVDNSYLAYLVFFEKKILNTRYAKYYFWQPAKAKYSVHFLPNSYHYSANTFDLYVCI